MYRDLETEVDELKSKIEMIERQLAVIQKHLERAANSFISASKVEKKEQRRKLP